MRKYSSRKISVVFCGFMMFLILLHSKQAIEGAKNGVILCLYTVIPALFPFSVLSVMLRSRITGCRSRFILHFEKICNMPEGFGRIFLIGLLGGYPIGAICIEESVKEGSFDASEVKYLRALCNNAGPSFIIGMTAELFSNKKYSIYLLVIQGLSAILTCAILSKNNHPKLRATRINACKITDALKTSCSSMAIVCGIIIFFNAFTAIIKNYITKFVTQMTWIIITGLLELTSGISLLPMLFSDEVRFIIAAGMLSFGGFCVTLQTISLSSSGGRYYIAGKLIQAMISVFLAYCIIKLQYGCFVIYLALFIIIRCSTFLRKTSAFL